MRSSTRDDQGSYLIMSIELPVAIDTAYEAWVACRQFPAFMRGEPAGEQRGLSRMTWRIHAPSGPFAWQATTYTLVAGDHIGWKGTDRMSPPNHGSVSFESVAEKHTLITIQAGFEVRRPSRDFGDPIPSLAQILECSLRLFHQRVACQSLPAQGLQDSQLPSP